MKTTMIQSRKARTVCSLLATIVLAIAANPTSVFADAEIYKQTLKSTTWILAKTESGFSLGSGVLVDKERRLVITNFHVVGDQREAKVFFPQMKDGRPIVERKYYLDRTDELAITGRVVAIDRQRDLAIIELPSVPEEVPAIEIAEKGVTPGAEVHSLGNPGSTDVLWVYTSGTVRAVYQKKFQTEAGEHDFTVVETQSPINAGDSGGPVVNDEGKLVAISQAMDPKARLVSYCVDLSEVKGFLAEDWKPAPTSVTQLMDKVGLKYTQHASGPYAVDFPIEGTTAQSVFITNQTEYFGKAEVRKIWSLAVVSKNALTTELALQLLQQNARTKMGAWTIEKNQQGNILIIFCVKLDATASADALKSAMEYVSKVTLVMNQQIGDSTMVAGSSDTQLTQPQQKVEQTSPATSDWFGGYRP